MCVRQCCACLLIYRTPKHIEQHSRCGFSTQDSPAYTRKMLKKTQGSFEVDPSRILVKGPEFLRKQMERENEANKGRVSAVERLAATKPQYVKCQQEVGSSQEPVISTESASGSSRGSSKEDDSVKNTVNVDYKELPEEDSNVVRRSSSKKRDSILLYRQKCELLRGAPVLRRRLNRKPLLTVRDKGGESDRATSKECGKESSQVTITASGTNEVQRATPHRKVLETKEQERKSRTGVARSSSDISSRYSKNFADFDVFFKYCGLDGDIIESLGKENFSARSDDLSSNIRSISVSTSDDGFSSCSDGLQEEELQETVRQGSSVIERNARIIKWLYSCRNAAESGKTLRDLD
uniref:Family with sequence similarity 110 member C n=1 Tax=Danio rerio TaxID=7955 RepID=X1WC17_DANRE|nr:protein FAM110C [Danio rerio]|eukprot:XP_021325696.1 protein FAM110C [Danio rerio]